MLWIIASCIIKAIRSISIKWHLRPLFRISIYISFLRSNYNVHITNAIFIGGRIPFIQVIAWFLHDFCSWFRVIRWLQIEFHKGKFLQIWTWLHGIQKHRKMMAKTWLRWRKKQINRSYKMIPRYPWFFRALFLAELWMVVREFPKTKQRLWRKKLWLESNWPFQHSHSTILTSYKRPKWRGPMMRRLLMSKVKAANWKNNDRHISFFSLKIHFFRKFYPSSTSID